MVLIKFRRAASAAIVVLAISASASAQSFDCNAARAPAEVAICSSAALIAKDKKLKAVYAHAMAEAKARAPQEAAHLRETQRKWIVARDHVCLAAGKEQDEIISCLTQAYDIRIRDLGRPAEAHAEVARGESISRPLPKETPKPAVEPEISVTRVAAAAKLAADEVPAAGEGQALLTVEAPGRFSIRAQSKTGVALQLVDMISGPGNKAGEPGVRDGRLDVLLDKGVYKIKSFGAEKATGNAKLTVSPFREAAGAIPSLSKGFDGGLGDLEQRSFAFVVGKQGRVAVEALGRSLQDLRLWRNGSDLVDLTAEFAAAEPRPGYFMTRARLEGIVEPGVYVVTAYGGEKLAWTDGANDEPFRIRASERRSLAAGVAEGVIGPFGAERFELSPSANYVRLDLPDVAAAQLKGARGSTALTARISKSSREPVAALELPTNGRDEGSAEVVGFEGQAFRILGLLSSREARVEAAGPHLISIDVAGEGGDELPATAVLARFANDKATVVASSAPHIGPGQAWRRKFNLRGVSSVIFQVTAPGPVAVRAEGVGVETAIEPILGEAAPRADGKKPHEYDLEAGWYILKIEPVEGAQGVLDLTLGQPGLLPAHAAPAAPRIAISFGVHHLDKNASYQILTGSAPGLVTGPKAIALPANLGKEPLAVFQHAQDKAAHANAGATAEKKPAHAAAPAPHPGEPAPQPQKPAAPPPLEIPVRIPLGGALSVTDAKGAAIEASLIGEKSSEDHRTLTVKIPPAKEDRTVILSWAAAKQSEEAPSPSAQEAAPPSLAAGKPHHFDLKRDEERNFRLEVAEGGLYRVETLGRLKTQVRLATAFIPSLATAEDNGAGHNALLQTYLRAGSYRVAVKASDSEGRLGLTAVPAALIETAKLWPEGSVRVSLSGGKGALIPFEIAEAGDYRLDLYGLNRQFTVRLEDAEGWPLATPGPLSAETRRFSAGRYRLVVSPQDVDARLVARLRKAPAEAQTEGHGPHALAFGHTQQHQWREPASKDGPRDPDRWEFALEGDANITLEIGDGMVGDLIGQGQHGDEAVAKIAYKRGFTGKLAAGRYRLEARSLGRNDRLDYQLSLNSAEIQPGAPRFVTAPASVPFAIAQDRVVSITTFGRTALSATLKDAEGRVVERLSDRADDWNIAMSRWLPAGAYSLELSKQGSGETAASSAESGESEAGGEAGAEAEAGAQESDDAESDPHAVEVRLALPETKSEPALELGRAVKFEASEVRQFPLPAAEAGRLAIAAAEADAELVASLEREEGGRWSALAFERGRAPVLAWPSDGKSGRLRLSVWTVDGGAAQIALSATAVGAEPQELGKIALKPVALDGLKGKFRAALVRAPLASLVTLAGQHEGLSASSAPGRVLTPASGGALIPQSERLWLLDRDEGEETAQLGPLSSSAGEIALALGEGERASLLQAPVPEGKLRLWRADSSFGQPGLDAGGGMGAAKGSALALVAAKPFSEDLHPLRVWNAGGREPLRLSAAPIEVALLPAVKPQGQLNALLPPFSALPARLGGSEGEISLDLAAGTAAIAKTAGARKVTVWTGSQPLSRTLAGGFAEVMLVNASGKPAPVRLTVAPAADEQAALTPAKIFKRFFGAAGSLSLAVEADAGDRLIVAGGDAVFVGADGAVKRGRSLALKGPGEVTLEHGAGLLAAWLERKGASPWPPAEALEVDLPSSVKLEGEAMSFKFAPKAPALLRARTTAPVILVFAGEAPLLYPAGAAFERYVPAGEAELRLYSPHDGPLSGALELSATPVIPISEGLGDPVAIAPGGTALFAFELKKAGPVGAGVRSEPDRAEMRLLDAGGKALGQGVNIIRRLEPGRYLIEARIPADGGAVIVRPSVIGIAPPPAGPPAEVRQQYLEMAGMKKAGGR